MVGGLGTDGDAEGDPPTTVNLAAESETSLRTPPLEHDSSSNGGRGGSSEVSSKAGKHPGLSISTADGPPFRLEGDHDPSSPLTPPPSVLKQSSIPLFHSSTIRPDTADPSSSTSLVHPAASDPNSTSTSAPLPPPKHHHHHSQSQSDDTLPSQPQEVEPPSVVLPRIKPPKHLPKGILKPPTVQPTRFSFRRDILQPFNSRLGSAAAAAYGAPTSSIPPFTSSTPSSSTSTSSTFSNSTSASTLASASTSSTSNRDRDREGGGAPPISGAEALAAAAGGFWGSALKRLSAVSNAASQGVLQVVPNHIPPTPVLRDLGEDPPTPSSRPTSTTSKPPSEPTISTSTSTTPVVTTITEAIKRPSSPTSHSHSHTALGPAPHTPSTRSSSTSTLPSTSPYATIRALTTNLSVPSPSSSSSTLIPSSSSSSSTTTTTTTLTTPSLPLPPPPTPLPISEMKKVRFRMATLKVVYPINNSGGNGPLAPFEEGLTKKRIEEEWRESAVVGMKEGVWNGETLSGLYNECCRTREEAGVERVRRTFRENWAAAPKVLDLTNELLTLGAVEAISDLLSVDFGLKKLVLENCGLDDDSLKPLLHSLLVSGNVPTVSLANNKRIRGKGWKWIAIFTRKAKFLRYLDLSDNSIDKKSAELLVQALAPPPPPPSLSAPASPTTTSPLSTSPKHYPPLATTPAAVSVETSPLDDVGGAEEDGEKEEDGEEDEEDEAKEPLFTVAPLLKETEGESVGVLSLRLENCGLKNQALEVLANGVRLSSLKHISIRKNRINAFGAVAIAIMIRDYPIASDAAVDNLSHTALSSASPPPLQTPLQPLFEPGNSVTARQALLAPYVRKTPVLSPSASTSETKAVVGGSGNGVEGEREIEQERVDKGRRDAEAEREAWKNSEARNKLKRQIEELPRSGSLLTLDVKGNEIRNGVTYISQVLKRNRTLKVLNLSENKIDVQGLVSIAEALKYNSTLETLDMSLNPCCGPGLEGITTLRAAITINSNLKRIFLNSTDLTSEGAIALAEFLPEARSLLHLDLTGNFDIDIAGVMALSVSVKMNKTLRCLDLNIPANDEDFARLSQEILQCCVRNTEIAQEESLARGNKVPIAAPILKSTVARDLKTRQEQDLRRSRTAAALAQSQDEIFTAADECRSVLSDLLGADESAAKRGEVVKPSEVVRDLLVQAQIAEAQLAEAISVGHPGAKQNRAVALSDQISTILDRAKHLYDRPVATPIVTTPLTNGTSSHAPISPVSPNASLEILKSPTFSITDSDDEEDAVEIVDVNPPSTSPVALGIEIPPTEEEIGSASPKSPLESQSRSLQLEEGEMFRKGMALGAAEVDDEEEADVSGEDLRKVLLETKVQRSPRTSFSFPAEEGRPTAETLLL